MTRKLKEYHNLYSIGSLTSQDYHFPRVGKKPIPH